ncbi:MAG: hypothetical protein C0593_01035 [Marinilabiliales bacterium]|nr:MAG: hypothetical protein C0593_01035 [Marinilabiliales bacterium]
MKTILLGLFTLLFFVGKSQITNNNKELRQKIDSVLSVNTDPNGPALSVIVTENGKEILFEGYYGMADVTIQKPLTKTHKLGIASMSKQFTGMAILCLVEDGKLKLEDDINTYFPELLPDRRKITIAQLLSHTSGLPEITRNEDFMNQIFSAHTIDEIIEMAMQGEYTNMPGVEWKYCNTGYTIMAKLIEKLSGMSFDDYLNKKIFYPLNMKNTYACSYYKNADDAVPRYFKDSTGYIPATQMHFSNLIGGGNVISNVSDMGIWTNALINGNNLPSNYQLLWKSNTLNNGEETGYGLGLGINSFMDKTYYYHPGMGDGMNAVNIIFPEEEIAITVIRNMSKPEFTSIEAALSIAKVIFIE